MMSVFGLKKAESYIQSGKLDRAEKEIRKLLRKNSKVFEAWLMLASVYGRTGRYIDAVSAAKNAISINSEHAVAYSLLGSASVYLGKFDEAIKSLETANRLMPGNAGVLNNLGNAFYAVERFDDAERCYRQVLEIDVHYPQANFGMGNCCLAKSLWTEAILYYQHAYNAMSDSYDINMSLGKAYRNVASMDESKECFLRAVKLTDQSSIAYYELAHGELLVGHLEEAQNYIEKSLKSQPGSIDSRAEQAEILYRMGHIDQAYEQIRELINEGHASPAVVLTWSNLCQHFDECSEVIESAETLLSEKKVSKVDEIALHFKLGKLYDMNAEFDRAFSHYYQGNNILPGDFDRDDFAGIVSNLIDDFNKDKIVDMPHTNCKDDRPVFIVGMPRSGTSLVEQIVSSHPDIFGAGELSYINTFAEGALIDTAADDVNRFNSLDVEKLDTLAEYYLSRINEVGGPAKRITDKMPHNFRWLGFIGQLFPNARIIHCRRDPRDTCLSIFFQELNRGGHSYATDLDDLAFYYRGYQKLMTHWQSVMKLPILDVSYSELVADTEVHTRKIIDFLDLDWDERCLNFHKSKRATATASWDQVRQPIYTKSLNRWKYYREHLGPLLDEFGEDDLATPPVQN